MSHNVFAISAHFSRFPVDGFALHRLYGWCQVTAVLGTRRAIRWISVSGDSHPEHCLAAYPAPVLPPGAAVSTHITEVDAAELTAVNPKNDVVFHNFLKSRFQTLTFRLKLLN
jgi:hypothetical protein